MKEEVKGENKVLYVAQNNVEEMSCSFETNRNIYNLQRTVLDASASVFFYSRGRQQRTQNIWGGGGALDICPQRHNTIIITLKIKGRKKQYSGDI